MKQFKKMMSMALAATLALSLLSGCAAKATDGEKPRESTAEETKVSAAPQFPKTFTGEWTGLDGYWHVEADAEVIVPEGPMPVAKVARREFTQEDVDNIIQVLLKGNTLYENLGQTRKECEEDIEHWEAILRGDIPYTHDGTIDRVPQLLEKAKERLKTAPNGDERIPADTSFHQPDMTGIQHSGAPMPDEVQGWAEVDGEKMNVSIRQMVPNDFGQTARVWTELYSTPMGPTLEKVVDQETFKLSREEAQKIGDDIVAGLGLEMVLDHMDAVIIEPENWGQYRAQFLGKTPPEKPADMPGYHLYYTRQVAGQKVGWMEGNYRSGSSESDNPAEYTKWSWHTEFLELCISEEGKVIYFNWEEPYTDPVIENPDAQLMEFSDIRDIFGKMIFVVNQYYREIDAKNGFACNYELTVDRVELTLARVHTRENFMEGKLVPVWDFYGTSRAYTNDEEYKDLVWDGVHENEIHLTINAMDGTILDRALGY